MARLPRTQRVSPAAEVIMPAKKPPAVPRRSREQIEFLPAALEVIDTPASPLGRATLWLITALVALLIAWACIGRVDVVAVAEGRVVPSGRTKELRPLETSIVSGIHVENGQWVKAGEVLIDLNPTIAAADTRRLTDTVAKLTLEVARLRALLTGGDVTAFITPGTVDADQIEAAQARLSYDVQAFAAKMASYDSEIAKRQSDQAASRAAGRQIERTLPLVRQTSDARETLAEKGFGSRLQANQDKQKVIEQEQQRDVERFKVDQAAREIELVQHQKLQAAAEHRRDAAAQLAENQKQLDECTQELVKAGQRQKERQLVAPIDGVVQNLAIHTLGGVVQAAEPILVVVPVDDQIEVEAKFLNRDIGFIRDGQTVAIKPEAFDFTHYGVIPGHVASVSRDSVKDEKLGLVYPSRITLDRTGLGVDDGNPLVLRPGMSVSAEVTTEHRRVISYLLGPLKRYAAEAIRER